MRNDLALHCVILCLLRILSYLTCAVLYSLLHQIHPFLSSDSSNRGGLWGGLTHSDNKTET